MRRYHFYNDYQGRCGKLRALSGWKNLAASCCSEPATLRRLNEDPNGPMQALQIALPRAPCVYCSKPLKFYTSIHLFKCIFVCLYVYMSVCLYVCTSVRLYVSMSVFLYVCTSVCLYVCMYACMPKGMYVCMYVCMHVCKYVCAYVSTCRFCRYMHRNKNTKKHNILM